MDTVSGTIERITFQNADTGFTVARLREASKPTLTVIVGTLPSLRVGESVRCEGAWGSHPSHGPQFTVESVSVEAPTTVVGIEKYLASGLVKGVGKVYAAKIVKKFGEETLNIIDNQPERLREVPGLGKKRLEQIKESWGAQRSIRELMVFLQSNGAPPSLAQKIFKKYGDSSLALVKENPYRLVQDIWGVGFLTADTIAQAMGLGHDAKQRVTAGISHTLTELSSDGHTCYPLTDLIGRASELLKVAPTAVEAEVETAKNAHHIVVADLEIGGEKRPFVWLRAFYNEETIIASQAKRLSEADSSIRAVDFEKAVTWAEEQTKIQLASQQRQAVEVALKEKVSIITGGPGTGKSTITKAIILILGQVAKKILLAAPTGRAAKRLNEITGKPATTIHSLLEFNFQTGGFKRNRDNPLNCDLMIVDESSMIDTPIMASLLLGLPDRARVIFIGDVHQLPSVGAGNVLKDLIASKSVAVTELTEIFRQSADSSIVTSAHDIKAGKVPDLSVKSNGDFFFLKEDDPEKIADLVTDLVADRLPKKYNLDPLQDIQVISPQRKGTIGITNLNQRLQKLFFPNNVGLIHNGQKLMMGDKVMQLRNNYQKEVFNGDIGFIEDIDVQAQEIVVRYDTKDVLYESAEFDEIVLAYAVSVHKYQGSECHAIVMPIHTTHYHMLHRNLIYTGVTRGKKLVVLVGTEKALKIAVNRNDSHKRHTGLMQFLRQTR